MVQTHAPKSRRRRQFLTSRWAGVLEQASVSRALCSKRSMVLASACGAALLLPTTLSNSSRAQGTQSGSVLLGRADSSFSATSVESLSPPLKGAGISTGEVTASPLHQSPPPSQLRPASRHRESLPLAVVSPPVPTMHITAIVGGRTQIGEVPVKSTLSVGQALAAMGISLTALDHVTPELRAMARQNMTIRVRRVESHLSITHRPVPAQLLYRPTTAIRAGAKQQTQAPREGQIEIIQRIWTLDGRETKREFVSRKLAMAPRPRIIALGARSNIMPGNIRPHRRYARAQGYVNSYRGGSPGDRERGLSTVIQSSDGATLRPIRCLENVVATGYSAGVAGGGMSNWTATGVRCTYGAVAVDPRVIPLGTKMYIEGYGYGFACDTGGAIKGNHIDLAFDSARAAMNHGKTRVRVWILGR